MSKDNKIIQFPNASERLLDKAAKMIEEEKYQKAFDMLETIETTEKNIIEVEFLRIICLSEFGIYEEAITKCQQILESVYVEEVLIIYVNLLKIVGRHEEAEAVQKEFEDYPEMDEEEFEEFNQFLDEMSENVEISLNEFKQAFADKDGFQQQILILRVLENKDITPFIPQMKNILKAKKPGLMIKTLILQLLERHEVSNKVIVNKLDRQVSVHPNDIPEEIYDWGEEIEDEIAKFVENEDPSLFNMSLQTWDHVGGFIFPLKIDEYSTKTWAASLISYSLLVNGSEPYEYKKLYQFLEKNKEEINEVLDLINTSFELSGLV